MLAADQIFVEYCGREEGSSREIVVRQRPVDSRQQVFVVVIENAGPKKSYSSAHSPQACSPFGTCTNSTGRFSHGAWPTDSRPKGNTLQNRDIEDSDDGGGASGVPNDATFSVLLANKTRSKRTGLLSRSKEAV